MTSKRTKTLPGMGGCVQQRDAHIITRIVPGNGTITVDSGGLLSQIGGTWSFIGSNVFELKPSNFQWLADLANHFAYWKLHRATLHITPLYMNVGTGTTGFLNGVAEFGFQDDPYLQSSTLGGVSAVLENRSSGEWSMARPFTLDYVPKGPQAGWLYCDSAAAGSTNTSTVRLSSAGSLLGASAVASPFASLTVGRVVITLDVSFKGSKAFQPVTLALEAKEAKSEQKVEAKAVTTVPAVKSTPTGAGSSSQLPAAGDYEMVEIPRPLVMSLPALSSVRRV